jgi:hypothetical protein
MGPIERTSLCLRTPASLSVLAVLKPRKSRAYDIGLSTFLNVLGFVFVTVDYINVISKYVTKVSIHVTTSKLCCFRNRNSFAKEFKVDEMTLTTLS